MKLRFRSLAFALPLAALALLLNPLPVLAKRSTLGVHVGDNLEWDTVLLGVEGRFDLVGVGSRAILQLNPTFSYYFDDDDNNLAIFNFSLNLPFEFQVGDSVLRPFFAPGLGVLHWSRDRVDDETDLKLNLIGGLLFYLAPVELFVQCKVQIGDGTEAEIIGGILFQL
jgi:hypothetical protein